MHPVRARPQALLCSFASGFLVTVKMECAISEQREQKLVIQLEGVHVLELAGMWHRQLLLNSIFIPLILIHLVHVREGGGGVSYMLITPLSLSLL